jgi:hypothetical protein
MTKILNIAHSYTEKLDKYVINYFKFNSKVIFEKPGCITNESIINGSAYTICSEPKQIKGFQNSALKFEQRQHFELNPIINALENMEEIVYIVYNRYLTEKYC